MDTPPFLRRGSPDMPVEMVLKVDGKTIVVEMPYAAILALLADGAGFLASKPEIFR